ncbi:radical SAM protein [Candidatus Pacearchaeota archaeon]|nr:radical SAM protein [Candidatus Pacearchaeota archaeon]
MITDIKNRVTKEVTEICNSQIKEVKAKGLTNEQINPRASFHLDTTKIAFHKERMDAWLNGQKIAPITIDMALTQKCSYRCVFCYGNLQKNPSAPVSWEIYEQFLDDCVAIGHKPGEGVKAISLVSDGESTLNPCFYDFTNKGKENGIDMAVGTNGFALEIDKLPQLINSLTYLRFNFDSADPQAYSKIMGTPEKSYHKVVDTIKACVKLKKEQGSDVTLGLQMVLLPEYADQVIPLALFGKELGVDYTVIKHCSDDEDGRLGVDYSWYKGELAQHLLETAESLSTDSYSVQAKWSKIRTGCDRKYTKCFGPPFHLQFSGSGIVAPCGSFFSPKYKKYHIGDLKKDRFKNIWSGNRYWNVMRYLSSALFDARKECATLCCQDKTNEVLFNLLESDIHIPDVRDKKIPMHMNFI